MSSDWDSVEGSWSNANSVLGRAYDHVLRVLELWKQVEILLDLDTYVSVVRHASDFHPD